MNFLPARIGEGGRVLHLPGGVDLPVPPARVAECTKHAGRDVTFGLRPEHITTGRVDDPNVFTIEGRVILVEPLGSDTLGLIKLGAADPAKLRVVCAADACASDRHCGLACARSLPLFVRPPRRYPRRRCTF